MDPKPEPYGISFIMGDDGWYKKTFNALFTAHTKVSNNPTADAIEEDLRYHGKKIPGPVFRAWQEFCQEVAKRMNWNSEAALILFYHPETKEWDAYPPKQDLSGAFVDFSGVTDAVQLFREKKGKDWLVAGTLHSHPPGCNWASNTDEQDEEKMDGVHLITPDWGRSGEKNIVAHVTCSKDRYSVGKPGGFLIDFSIPGVNEYPEEWLGQCKFSAKGERWGKHQRGGYSSGGGSSHSSGSSSVTGNEFVHNGQGASTFRIEVNGRENNILAEQWNSIEPKTLLKKIGFTKKRRNFLMREFGEDMKDLTQAFDYTREALEYIKGIRGDIAKHEREKMIDKAGESCKVMLETIKSISERILNQSKDAPKEEASDKKGDDTDADVDENEGKEGEGKVGTDSVISRDAQHFSEM